MLINEGAIILNLLSIALLGLLAATALQSFVSSLAVRRISQFSAGAQKIALWGFAITPWIVGFICVLLFTPALIQPEVSPWLDRLAHWHHPYVFYLDSWHAATLVLFALAIIYGLVRKGLSAARHSNTLDTLAQLSQGKARHWAIGQDIVVLESDTPSAFAAGLLHPKCYVTTGLIERVLESELDIIIDHERAHIRNRDAQKKWLFALLASLFPKPAARCLTRQFSLASELLADAQVVKSYNIFDIAQTLVNAARIQRMFAGNSHRAITSYFIDEDVDVRVKALVAPQVYRSFPWAYGLVFLSLTTFGATIGVDGLHHLIEAIFSH